MLTLTAMMTVMFLFYLLLVIMAMILHINLIVGLETCEGYHQRFGNRVHQHQLDVERSARQ